MNKNSREKLVSLALALGAGIFLTLPALANDSTTVKSQAILAQSGGSGSGSGSGSSGGGGGSSQSKPSSSPSTSSTSSRGVSSQYPTGQKLSQAVKDTNALPGGWLCLNNPNSQCIEQSRSK